MIGIWYFSATGNGEKIAKRIAKDYLDGEI